MVLCIHSQAISTNFRLNFLKFNHHGTIGPSYNVYKMQAMKKTENDYCPTKVITMSIGRIYKKVEEGI